LRIVALALIDQHADELCLNKRVAPLPRGRLPSRRSAAIAA
jgi:hypothetical protein